MAMFDHDTGISKGHILFVTSHCYIYLVEITQTEKQKCTQKRDLFEDSHFYFKL